MKVVFVSGSPNKNGTTEALFDLIKSGLTDCEIISVNAGEVLSTAKYPFCLNCSAPCSEQCYKGTALEKAFDDIASSDFVVFGSPVYFGAVSAQLKAFFDKTRAIRGKRAWVGIPCAAVTSGGSKYGGQQATVDDIHHMCLVQGMTVVGDSSVETGAGHFGLSSHRKDFDEYTLLRAKALSERIMSFKK